MVITTTGVAFSLSALGLAFCGFWFFRAFQKIGGLRSGSRVGILLSILFLGTAFEHGVLAIGGLFFSDSPEALYSAFVISHLVLAVVTALGVYLAFYILLPNFSPWPATILTLLYGIFVIALTLIEHPQPSIVNYSVDWGMKYRTELLLYFLLFMNIGTPFLIFAKNLFQPVSRDVKIISFIVTIATILGLINVSILFSGLFRDTTNNDNYFLYLFDRILSIIGLLFIIGFLIIPIYWLVSKRLYKNKKEDVYLNGRY